MGRSDHKKPAKKAVRRASAPAINGRNGSRAKLAKPEPARTPKVRLRESAIVLPDDYRPSENEPFMNERHKLYFRKKLVAWKEEIVRQNRETLQVLHEDSA